ncbi:hypothetical protein N7333_12995 [Pseudomonas sp. GD04158]|uniref:hypothetical protein n=1 Tax=Pseudomonas sp. GD04158 TaxID=2975439 RepID=UPI00244C11D3|nr:hypothetical protein [Pseudomonas sp. GD04158]MDH0097491.1 hypothetical protein [Pseudomonas sp. GD04158]
MELTTPQIYGIFAALSCAAIAGFIFYCIGLRAGRDAGEKQGRETAAKHCKAIVHPLREALAEHRDLLDARTREAMTLRANIKAEADDHGKVERGLLNRLAAAAPLSDEDHAVLLAVANKLELAAGTFAGLGSHDHARFSRHLMAQVLDIADRIKKAQANTQPHPDSELIEWLNDNAVHYIPDMSLVQIEMPTLLTAADTWPPHLRQMLRAGIAKQAAEAVENAA